MTLIAEPGLAVVDHHEEAEAAHDADAAAGVFAADGILEPKPVGATLRGDEIRGFYADLFTAFPDLSMELIHRYQTGNMVIEEAVFSGTHRGVFAGVLATGQPVTVPAGVVYEVRDGKLARETIYWDMATVLVQMGVLPAPGDPGAADS